MLSNHFNTHNSNYMFRGRITGQIFSDKNLQDKELKLAWKNVFTKVREKKLRLAACINSTRGVWGNVCEHSANWTFN